MNESENQAQVVIAGTGSIPQSADDLQPSGKKRYTSPTLAHQAHLRDITLAPTPGIEESGLGTGFKGPGETDANDKNYGKGSNESGDIFENDIFGG